MPREWSKQIERPELWFYIFWKGSCLSMPPQHCSDPDKNMNLLNQQTSLLSALWTLPSKCSPGPISFNSFDLSRVQTGAWKIGGVFRCLNLLNMQIPAANFQWHQAEWCSRHAWGMGCHPEGPGQAWEVGPCEPHGVQQGQVQGPTHASGQPFLSTQARG